MRIQPTQEVLRFGTGRKPSPLGASSDDEKTTRRRIILRHSGLTQMVIRANRSCRRGNTPSNGISSRARNDVESTANRQRAGGPLHLIRLTSRADGPRSCASMTQEKI